MSLPHLTIAGNLTADPELRFAPSGVALSNFTVACSSRKKNDAGEWVDDKTLFMPVTVFRDPAEHTAESLKKGDGVIVEGRIYTDTWEDKESGAKRSMVKMLADEVGVSLKYRIVPHGAGRTERSTSQTTTAADPYATGGGGQQDSEPPPF